MPFVQGTIAFPHKEKNGLAKRSVRLLYHHVSQEAHLSISRARERAFLYAIWHTSDNALRTYFFGYLRNHEDSFRRITPRSASEKIPPDILLVPSTRLIKIMGTSRIVNPH